MLQVASLVARLEEGLRREAELKVKAGESEAREERERARREAAELRWLDACLRVEEAMEGLEHGLSAVSSCAVGIGEVEALRRERDALQV